MGKVVEGQMEFLALASDMSRISSSAASETLRTVIDSQARQQQNYPDVLPSRVEIHPLIEASTGRIMIETA